MSGLVAHFGSGDAFFTGTGIMLLAVGLRRTRGLKDAPALLIGVIGAIVIAFSAVPLPLWYYVIWGICVVIWSVMQRETMRHTRASRIAAGALAALCVGGMAMEVPWHMMPRVTGGPYDTVCVIGDSVSAGIGEKETWPVIFHERFGVEVVDLSHAGEIVETAFDETERIPQGPCIVLLEIGGNDLLGRTSAAKYRAGLDALLQAAQGPGRALVMLELPLPPGSNSFGAIQRELSRKYNVALIPRRQFMRILAGKGLTVDGIHLSARGHEAMAEMIQRALGSALKSNP